MPVLRELTQVLEIVARHQAKVATTLSLSEQVAMADFQTAFEQMGNIANTNTPSSAQVTAREFAVNRNEAVYGLSNAIRPLDAQPITTSIFADSGRTIVHPVSIFALNQFKGQARGATKPRIRVPAGVALSSPQRTSKDNVIHLDFGRNKANDYGLVR
jgi:hypothetical protein